MNTNPVQTKYLRDYTAPAYEVEQLDLTFDLYEEHCLVTAVMKVRQLRKEIPFICDGQELELVSLKMNREELQKTEYELTPEQLILPQPPAAFTLEVVTKLYPYKNTSLEGLYRSQSIFCTQCEAEGFRRITYFPDRPDVMTYYTTTIIADQTKNPVLLSNGNPVEKGTLEHNRHWVKWVDPFKKPCYLFALVAGDLRVVEGEFTTQSGRRISLQIFVEEENLDKCDHALSSLKRAMKWDEEKYGLEYDLDIYMIVAVNDFNAGAMENKGLNIFNSSCVLARPDTATDVMYERIEGVVAHEYFHNWTGNRITCRDWFQLSLKEGLTVFRDQQFTADMTSKTVKRIKDVDLLRRVQFAEDAGGMAHAVRPDSFIKVDNFYTVTIYEKGAEVIRMIHTLLGDQGFRKGFDLYFERHDGQAVTTDDFVQAMEDATGVDLTQFRSWYHQAGTPEVEVFSEYNAEQQTFSLTLRQKTQPTAGQKNKVPLHIPLAVGLLGKEGNALPLQLQGEVNVGSQTRILNLTQAEESFVFEQITEKPFLSILREFSAPIKLKQSISDEELSFLMAHDPDLFNRWEAAQQFFQRVILGLVENIRQQKELLIDLHLVEALRKVIKNSQLDLNFIAALLQLPAESYLIDQMSVIDIDGVSQAREFVKQQLALVLEEEFLQIIETNIPAEKYEYTALEVGKRSLRNTALNYLSCSKNTKALGLCSNQYQQSNNMTDEVGALSCLVNQDYKGREQDLEKFHQKWKQDTLVMDIWFALQAGAKSTEVEKIRELMEHPAFDQNNPNKVRALIGTFCSGNLKNFHDQSGKGYRFLADEILRLDQVNPYLAARMLTPFNRWRKFDAQRQQIMKEQLLKIKTTAGLSKNTYEIAAKSLSE